ncbi:MAG: response regulator transcription factor, partial [Halioglobus sp.]|nr:response regulator transcription factor [Halioglobus sp.]
MARVLVSAVGESRQRWQEAFPAEPVVSDMAGLLQHGLQSLWLDLGSASAPARVAALQAALTQGCPVIAMAATPSEADAFVMLQAGAKGYCHALAAPEQLREIALVVEHGGLWMPSELMQRFVTASARLVPGSAPQTLELNALTSRELMVAEQVARGASNREIAGILKISERTVKAHL